MRMSTVRISTWMNRRATEDRGVALVAAMSVAIIGMALALVVVTQAIVVTNDSQRDRVRTAEIHSAEGVLDASFYEMATRLGCSGPSFSPMTVGEGTEEVEVTVTYQYFDDNGVLSSTLCDASTGTFTGKPTGAVVTAVAVPTQPTAGGLAPQRIIEATVELVPGKVLSEQSAIFAGGNLATTNPVTLTSADASLTASIRVEGEGANWQCQSGGTINGNVTVVRGKASFNVSSCVINGNLWVRDGFSMAGGAIGGGKAQITGNVTVANGNFTVSNDNYRVGGDLRVKGTTGAAWQMQSFSANSICSSNTTPCPASYFTPPAVIGLPEFDFIPTDWSGQGYALKSRATFEDEWIAQAGTTAQWQVDSVRKECAVAPWNMWNGKTVIQLNGGPSVAKKSVYDLRTCPSGLSIANMTLQIYADTAIFAKSFITNGPTKFVSGDGKPHTLFLVVPDGGTANNDKAECTARGSYTPGNMTLQTGVTTQSPMEAVFYTPCDMHYTNSSTSRGQLYARNITFNEPQSFEFIPVNVPGNPLDLPTESTGNYTVQVLYKQERRN